MEVGFRIKQYACTRQPNFRTDLVEQCKEVIAITRGAIEDRALLDSTRANVVKDIRSLEPEIAWHRFRR